MKYATSAMTNHNTKIVFKKQGESLQLNSQIPSKKQNNSVKMSRKNKTGKKKLPDSSNWAKLCSELKKDPHKRKKVVSEDVSDHTQQVEEQPKKVTKQEVWFDDVDEILLEKETESSEKSENGLVKADSYAGVTKCIGMDCEMVGIGADGEDSILARVSLVNHFGACIYDKFVSPREKVTDYRTHVSGVTKEILASKGEKFDSVQKEVSNLMKGRILVGHALHNDLKVLFLSHPRSDIRDTSLYKPFRTLFNGRLPSLKKLTEKVLGVKVQEGEHSSVQDAQAAMRLYTFTRKKWEAELKTRTFLKSKRKSKRTKIKEKSKVSGSKE